MAPGQATLHVTADPNGAITSPRGTFAIGQGAVAGRAWINTDGSTSWSEYALSGGSVVSYAFSWGSNFGSGDTGKYAEANGISNGGKYSLLDYKTEHTMPRAGTITRFAWSTQSADATTIMKIWKNGLVAATINLTGANGSATVSVAVAAGDQIAIEFDTVQQPGESIWEILVQ